MAVGDSKLHALPWVTKLALDLKIPLVASPKEGKLLENTAQSAVRGGLPCIWR